MTEEDVVGLARAGAAAGCHEALFTLGDKPELRYKVARASPTTSSSVMNARSPRLGGRANVQ